nr:MAG TPA: hypothetical protein [Caudoviricetes sp.]
MGLMVMGNTISSIGALYMALRIFLNITLIATLVYQIDLVIILL